MTAQALLVLLLLVRPSIFALATSTPGATDEDNCVKMRTEYKIEPGKSFGQLPSSLHGQYLALRCYRFFCEPHELAGKGVFPCTPLKKATVA